MKTKALTRLSIGQKIISAIVFVSMFSIIVAISGLSLNKFRSTQENVKREVVMISEVIAQNMTAAVVFQDSFAAQELLNALKDQPIIEYARAENSEHLVIAEYGNSHSFLNIEPLNDDLFKVKTSLRIDNKIVGTLTIIANNIQFYNAIKIYLTIAILVFIVSLVCSVILSIWIQRCFATPIIELAEVANEVAVSGNYGLRVKSKVKGEIGLLLSVFNDLLLKINEREQELEAIVQARTSELKSLNEQLKTQAHYDSLTKLPNRMLFEDRLKQSIAQAARENTKVALMFVDLDKFKDVNDTLGHAAGDALLCQVARRLQKQCRSMDSVARIGGDEFTLLFMIDDQDNISELSHRIVDIFQVPFNILDQSLLVTLSVGVAIYPTHGHDYDVLKAKSDEAMYQAKHLGRNQFYIYQ